MRNKKSAEASIGQDPQTETSRRSFSKLLTFGGLAAALAGLAVYFRAKVTGNFPPRTVAQANEIPVGGTKIFTYPTESEPCILMRPAADKYVAFSRLCTHASCPVFYNAGAHQIDCPCHGGVFSAVDGSVLQGPPPRPLPKITIEQRGGDIVATGITTS